MNDDVDDDKVVAANGHLWLTAKNCLSILQGESEKTTLQLLLLQKFDTTFLDTVYSDWGRY